MSYQYSVGTPHGDVDITTPHHHSAFASLEDFLNHHHNLIAEALSVATLSVSSMSLYLSHGRKGARLR